jgi:hypothetical protein
LCAGFRPATAPLTQTPNRHLYSHIDLQPVVMSKIAKPRCIYPATPSTIPPDRAAFTKMPHPPRSNLHSSSPLHRRTCPSHRGFLPWRLSDAGRQSMSCRRQRPASETLHISSRADRMAGAAGAPSIADADGRAGPVIGLRSRGSPRLLLARRPPGRGSSRRGSSRRQGPHIVTARRAAGSSGKPRAF